MFAAVLDDQSILNDPVNEDILDDMLKYLDIFAEDLFPEPKRGDSIYSTRPEDDLKIGKFEPQNKPTEAFAFRKWCQTTKNFTRIATLGW